MLPLQTRAPFRTFGDQPVQYEIGKGGAQVWHFVYEAMRSRIYAAGAVLGCVVFLWAVWPERVLSEAAAVPAASELPLTAADSAGRAEAAAYLAQPDRSNMPRCDPWREQPSRDVGTAYVDRYRQACTELIQQGIAAELAAAQAELQEARAAQTPATAVAVKRSAPEKPKTDPLRRFSDLGRHQGARYASDLRRRGILVDGTSCAVGMAAFDSANPSFEQAEAEAAAKAFGNACIGRDVL